MSISIPLTQKYDGFTLIEILLVLVIIGLILLLSMGYVQQRTQGIRIDRTSAQMQQILNAGLSYYVGHAQWPADLDTLRQDGYLPLVLHSPWGTLYQLSPNNEKNLLSVSIEINKAHLNLKYAAPYSTAAMIAGNLPLGHTATSLSGPVYSSPCTPSSRFCYAMGSVNIPGQNLNNASAVNFSGLYHSGACVPVPQCPVDLKNKPMTPQIFVVPVAVNGVSDDPGSTPPSIYPISGFAGFATTPDTSKKVSSCADANTQEECKLSDHDKDLQTKKEQQFPHSSPQQYWRICIKASTSKGEIKPDREDWGKEEGILLAFTRCAITDEVYGSDFKVWSP